MSSKVNILIVDDHPIFRMGLTGLLYQLPFIGTIDEAENGGEALHKIAAKKPTIVLLDIEMPVMNGLATLQEVRRIYKDSLKVLILSMSSHEKHLIEMYDNGADGYLLKNTDATELQRAIELVLEGQNYFTPEIAAKMFKVLFDKDKSQKLIDPIDAALLAELTDREKDVLTCICDQYSSREIADKLCISEQTVKKHRENLIKKTDCKNLAGLVVYAIRNGIFQLK